MKRKTGTSPVTNHLVALSDMVRLRILRILEKEELAVGEVAKVVQLPQSTVSRHLKSLADGGWVFKRTEGTATLYRVVMDDLPAGHRALWVAVREMLRADLKRAGDSEEDLRRLAAVRAERRLDASAFFGRVAGQWDDLRAELFGARFMQSALLHLLPPGWTVIDAGCGTGNVSELLAPVVKRVIAIDSSGPMLAAAEKRLSAAGRENVEFRREALNGQSLGAPVADAAVCALVLAVVEEPERVLRSVRSLLKPGGRVVVVDMVEHDRATYKHTMGHKHLGFSEGRVMEFLREAGFENGRVGLLPSDPAAKGPGLFVATACVSKSS